MNAEKVEAGSNWLRWFPTGSTCGNGWYLVRFESVDPLTGLPLGKALTAVTPSLWPRRFPTEEIAQLAANFLNREEGRHA